MGTNRRDLLTSRAAGSLALAAFAACHGGSSGSGVLTPGLTNTGVSAATMVGAGDLKLLVAVEPFEGKDLNGDGDQDDQVATEFDLFDGSRHALGLALSSLATVGDVLIALGVPEDSQGQTDLNGDGDADDTVLFVYDNRTGVATNSGYAMGAVQPAIGAGLVSFGVSEFAQGGSDLDGDGLAASTVLFVYDSRTGLSTNSTRPVTSEIVASDHEFAFTTTEAVTGDLNGDGDASDTQIFQLYDGVLGGIVSVPVEVLALPIPLGEDWYVLVSESAEGQDLNGDGDLQDGVWFVTHPHLGTKESLGLSSSSLFGSRACGSFLVVAAQEIDGIDRNGDGDLSDILWVIHDPSQGTNFDTRLAVGSTPVAAGGRIALGVPEDQGEDLNGDGDFDDAVLELVDPVLDTITNTGLDVFSQPEAWGSRLFFARFEGYDGADWNGDGDDFDRVFFTLDPLTGDARPTGIASLEHSLGATDERLLLLVPENDEGRDLNGDGDTDDLVYVLRDLATEQNQSLGLAAELSERGGLAPGGRGALLVSEAQQEADLNHDGDRVDGIFFVLE